MRWPGRTNGFGSNRPNGRRSIASRDGGLIRFCVVVDAGTVVEVDGTDVDEVEDVEDVEDVDDGVTNVVVVLVLEVLVVVLVVLVVVVGTGATFEKAIPVKVHPCVVCKVATADDAEESYSSGSLPVEQPSNATPCWTFCCAQLTSVADQFAGEIGEHRTFSPALVNDVTFQFASDPSNWVLVNIPLMIVTDDVFQSATELLKFNELLNM